MSSRTIFLFALLFPGQLLASNILSVSPKWANVRSGPGTEYEVVWEAARYYPLEIVDSDGSWLKVSDYENAEGWVNRSVLAGVAAVVVISKQANVRSGPGMEYETLWVLRKEYSLKVLEVEGSWIKVTDEDEVTGWIHNNVVWGFTERPELEKAQAY